MDGIGRTKVRYILSVGAARCAFASSNPPPVPCQKAPLPTVVVVENNPKFETKHANPDPKESENDKSSDDRLMRGASRKPTTSHNDVRNNCIKL